MKLTELFHLEQREEPISPEEPIQPSEALSEAFAILSRNDLTVAETLADCIANTKKYFAAHGEVLERRGLQYSEEACPWLRVIAAVQSAMDKGYLCELYADCSMEDFICAVKFLLDRAGIVFSTDQIRFDPQKNLAAWVRQFNGYAGQSGITLLFIDLYSDSRTMGVAYIADYVETVEMAGYAGVKITCRPD